MVEAKVVLLSHTPQPEKTVAMAAKVCTSAAPLESIGGGLTEEAAAQFVDMLAEVGHESPIEHASFTFGLTGVSRSLLAEITRHRIASYSVRSQRYVDMDAFEFVVPPEIAGDEELMREYLDAMEEDRRHYERLCARLTEKRRAAMLAAGADAKTAERGAKKKAQEDARFVLPNACATQLVMTMNARSLMNFFRQRCCERAQWEIRGAAEQMLTLVLAAAPNLFKNAGPACLRGPCPEGKMCCGHLAEVRARFRALKGGKA